MRKALYLLLIASVFVPATLQAQVPPPPGDPWCMNNCGAFTGDCTACHRTEGPLIWIADAYSGCQSCAGSGQEASAIKPQVPMRNDPVKTLWAWVQTLQGKQDPKYTRITSMTPERHVQLMQRGVRLKLDGAALGACSHAFNTGTLAKLPAEIWQTQTKLAEHYAVNFTPIKPQRADNPIPGGTDPCWCKDGLDHFWCSIGLADACTFGGGDSNGGGSSGSYGVVAKTASLIH